LGNTDTLVGSGTSETGLWLFLANEAGFLGAIRLEDELRPGAAQVIADLHGLKLEVSLLSGDRPPVVAEVAKTLGITHWQGAALPEDKLARVRNLQGAGGKVMMVGDGINDVPVLSGADISVAMGDAVDLTRLHADALLVSGNLDVLADAVRIARKTTTIIRQNLAWALGYNLLALPLAAMGQIPPWAAAIGMSASSLIVVVNGLRLARGNLNRA
jgi:Cu2+-exporting ATPase